MESVEEKATRLAFEIDLQDFVKRHCGYLDLIGCDCTDTAEVKKAMNTIEIWKNGGGHRNCK
jgi:hypothetical protein